MAKLKGTLLSPKSAFRPAVLLVVVALLAAGGLYLIFRSHAARLPGDVNNDGVVNSLDLSIIASNLGKTGQTFAEGDLNGDGLVNTFDLSILASLWQSTATPPNQTAPATPADTGAVICGNHAMLDGPATKADIPSVDPTAPYGTNGINVISEPAGANAIAPVPGKTYYFATGVHHINPTILATTGDVFIGAPGAIIDGQGTQAFAIQTQYDTNDHNITIEYLTIQNFNPPEAQSVINEQSSPGFTITHNTITANAPGAAVSGSDNLKLTYNCLSNNGEYAINGFESSNNNRNDGIPTDMLIDHNEMAGNDTELYDTPGHDMCGCSGAFKLWASVDATVTNNYVHDNHSIGMWFDTANTGALVQGNWIGNNYAEGVWYEVSYNFNISYNTLADNGWGKGPWPSIQAGFPEAAIYISESGSDSRVGDRYQTTASISHNKFIDNWGGVDLWENSNRFCAANMFGDVNAQPDSGCTLVNPSVITRQSCHSNLHAPPDSPYLSDCRWKTQNVSVDHNSFSLTPANVNPGATGASVCTIAHGCGLVGAVFSNFPGTNPPSSAYPAGVFWPTTTTEHAITFTQNNLWAHNTYNGPFKFFPFDQGTISTFAQWQAGQTGKNPPEDAGGSCTGCL